MRREFSKPVRLQIVRRAMNARGEIACEGCGLMLGKKRWDVDHTIPDGLAIDKSRGLTAEDGRLLGWECCHRPKTANDAGNIARAKRRADNHTGNRKRSVMPGSRDSKFKKHVDGRVTWR